MDEEMTWLWLMVIIQAFTDATAIPSTSLHQIEIEQAREYLLGNSEDFIDVCQMADLIPNAVRRRAIEYTNNGWESSKNEFRKFERSLREERLICIKSL